MVGSKVWARLAFVNSSGYTRIPLFPDAVGGEGPLLTPTLRGGINYITV